MAVHSAALLPAKWGSTQGFAGQTGKLVFWQVHPVSESPPPYSLGHGGREQVNEAQLPHRLASPRDPDPESASAAGPIQMHQARRTFICGGRDPPETHAEAKNYCSVRRVLNRRKSSWELNSKLAQWRTGNMKRMAVGVSTWQVEPQSESSQSPIQTQPSSCWFDSRGHPQPEMRHHRVAIFPSPGRTEKRVAILLLDSRANWEQRDDSPPFGLPGRLELRHAAERGRLSYAPSP